MLFNITQSRDAKVPSQVSINIVNQTERRSRGCFPATRRLPGTRSNTSKTSSHEDRGIREPDSTLPYLKLLNRIIQLLPSCWKLSAGLHNTRHEIWVVSRYNRVASYFLHVLNNQRLSLDISYFICTSASFSNRLESHQLSEICTAFRFKFRCSIRFPPY